MAYVLRLNQKQPNDPPVLREIKCRLWWSLFMADKWCPPGLGLPREIRSSDQSVELPMRETDFQTMENSSQICLNGRSEGFWKYKITLVDILSSIQDVNLSLVQNQPDRSSIDQHVSFIASQLQRWLDTLPEDMVMSDYNLDMYRSKGHGGTFIALHLGYHHYSTLLFFQYLEASPGSSVEAASYTYRCRYHALAYSRLLYCARQHGDCHLVYLTVAHMTMVSSSVLLHMLLFGNDEEMETARTQLTRNFEALIELTNYWPHMDKITQRLLIFQNACLRPSTQKAYAIDKWMVRFLLEHALPLTNKTVEDETFEMPQPLSHDSEVSLDRRNMLDEAFADLRT